MKKPAKTEEMQTITETPAQFEANNLIAQAIAKETPVETVEKLLAMRRELKQEWAKEQYYSAMSVFQRDCPVIEKKKAGGSTKSGKVAYKYAPLDSIIEQTQKIIADNGFSYTFKQENEGIRVKMTCIVSHISGHSESSAMETGLATKTNIMSGPQQIASTVTFNKRYAFCNAFGIMTGDEDVDAAKRFVEPPRAQLPPPSYALPAQVKEIIRLFGVLSVDEKAQKDWLLKTEKVNNIHMLTEARATKIIKALKEKSEKKSEEKPKEDLNTDKKDFNKRAMACKSLKEARDIMGEMKTDNQTESTTKIVKGLLFNAGFNLK